RYDITVSGFSVGLSAELDDDLDAAGDAEELDDPMLGIGAKYTIELAGGSVALGAAYQGAEDTYLAGASAGASFGDLSVGASFFDGEISGVAITGAGDDRELTITGNGPEVGITYYGLSVGYSFGAASIGVNYGLHDVEDEGEISGYGITAGYDLGGGLSLQAGYGYGEIDPDAGDTLEVDSYSFGVAMSF
ncbi:MAG: porin, partial [Pseudomonadota bacterium]